MSFQGSLRELQLSDIVQLVSSSGKTGKFALHHDDEQGDLYVKDGRIVHAQVAGVTGDEAVYILASWASGEFFFTPGAETDRVTVEKSNTRILMEAAHQQDEWRVLARKIPGLSAVPTLASPDAARPVTLSPGEWRQIVAIDGKKSIRELGRESGTSSFDVAKTLFGLVTAGLVEMRPPARERTPLEPGEEKRILAILCTRIRQEAELALGEPVPAMLESAQRRALSRIERGAGLEALRELVSETGKAITSRRGAAPSRAFQEKMPFVLQPKA